MSETVTVAALQISSQADVDENLSRVAVWVGEAARRGARLVLLPENFAYLGDEEGKRAIAEELSLEGHAKGPIAARLEALARSHGVYILAGGMPERSSDPDRPYNTCVVVSPEGRISALYRKIHLFDVDIAADRSYRESVATMPGDEPRVVTVEGLRVGLSICYDVRFPELYRALSAAGAEVMVVPAAFTVATGKDHWHVLLRARAIEAQAYVIAAAQWGKHPRGRQTYGKSCIIDPWGEIVAQASEGEGVITAAIERHYLAQVRAALPSLKHRRLGLTR